MVPKWIEDTIWIMNNFFWFFSIEKFVKISLNRMWWEFLHVFIHFQTNRKKKKKKNITTTSLKCSCKAICMWSNLWAAIVAVCHLVSIRNVSSVWAFSDTQIHNGHKLCMQRLSIVLKRNKIRSHQVRVCANEMIRLDDKSTRTRWHTLI